MKQGKNLTALKSGDRIMVRLDDRRTISVFRPIPNQSNQELRWNSGDNQFLMRDMTASHAYELIELISQVCNLRWVVSMDLSQDPDSPRITYTMVPNTTYVYITDSITQSVKDQVIEHAVSAGWSITQDLEKARYVISGTEFSTNTCEETKIFLLAQKPQGEISALARSRYFDLHNLTNFFNPQTSLQDLLRQGKH